MKWYALGIVCLRRAAPAGAPPAPDGSRSPRCPRRARRASTARALLLTALALAAGATRAADAPPRTAAPEDAVVLIRTLNSLRSARGSGFLVGDGSWAVTASHVVAVDLGKGRKAADGTALVFSPWTGRAYEARVVAIDAQADIALLKLPQAGLPALPLENIAVKNADALPTALGDRMLRLYGFPLAYGEDTVAALARPEHWDSKIQSVLKRGETSLCVLNASPDVQPGWSGGPMLSVDHGGVIGVFHSLYRKGGMGPAYPAGSASAYLADLLRTAGAGDPETFTHVAPPTVSRPANASELMARQMRSLSWSAVGNWRKAEEEQREIVKLAPGDALARTERGRLLLQLQKYDEALSELREAVRLTPKSITAQLFLGRACHLNYDPKGAIAALSASVAASGGKEVEPQLQLATVYEDNQKLELAEKTLRDAVSGAPTHPAALFRLAELLLREKKEEEAFKLFTQATDLSLADPALSYVPLGHARALDNARRVREAEGVYRQVVHADPENGTAFYYLAQLLYREGRYEDAQAMVSNGIRAPGLSEELVQAFRTLQLRINEKGN